MGSIILYLKQPTGVLNTAHLKGHKAPGEVLTQDWIILKRLLGGSSHDLDTWLIAMLSLSLSPLSRP